MRTLRRRPPTFSDSLFGPILTGPTSGQSLATSDLFSIPFSGITLDTGSTLATAEEPVDFARRVAPHLKNVHLKDYQVYMYNEGYRLVRCPLGQGVVNFPALFNIFSETCPRATMSIELGALEARHVRVLPTSTMMEL